MASELSKLQPYRYEALPSPRHTRVIKIASALFTGQKLNISLKIISLDDKIGYRALSYHWGGQSCTQTVICDGNSVLRVTPNARAAMRALQTRTRLSNQYLWVDAICIDQTSTEEKTVQVSNMAEIYSKAKQVCVWLQDHGEIKSALKRIDKVRTNYRSPKEVQEQKDGILLGAISINPFWSRIWTVQERALARSVKLYYGSTSMGSKLQSHIDCLDPVTRYPFAAHEAGFFRHKHASLDSPSKYDEDVSKLLITLLNNDASIPHDYIYGLRALYPRTLSMSVDYNRSFLDLACEAGRNILASGEWDLLRMANHKGKGNAWPSWLPDWRSSQKQSWYPLRDQRLSDRPRGDTFYRRSRGRRSPGDPIRLLSNGRSLVLQAKIIDSIVISSTDYIAEDPDLECYKAYKREMYRPKEVAVCRQHFFDKTQSWIHACTSHFGHVDVHGQLVEMLCRFPLKKRAAFGYEEQFKESKVLLNGDWWLNGELGYPDLEINPWLSSHSFSMLSNGTMAVSVGKLQKGDVIVLFPDMGETFALRPVTTATSINGHQNVRYELLCEAELYAYEEPSEKIEVVLR